MDYRSGQPLYIQIVESFKRLILSGVIKENERLPSVRDLASQLAINPNTIQRAYRELETEGYVGTSPGKGIFAVGADALKDREIEVIYKAIGIEVQKLLDYGLEANSILQQLNVRFNNDIYSKNKDAGGDRHDIDD